MDILWVGVGIWLLYFLVPIEQNVSLALISHNNQTWPEQTKLGPDVPVMICLFLQSLEWIDLKRFPKPTSFALHSFFFCQGIQRLYDEGDDGEELDEGVGEEAVEEEEQDEEDDKEKDGESDAMQTKDHLLPERRSRRLKSEVNKKTS